MNDFSLMSLKINFLMQIDPGYFLWVRPADYCACISASWWRHQMETFSVSLAISAGNSPVSGEFLAQRPLTRSFDGFFDLRLNKRLSKQSWRWWFETLSRPLLRHRNDYHGSLSCYVLIWGAKPLPWPILSYCQLDFECKYKTKMNK